LDHTYYLLDPPGNSNIYMNLLMPGHIMDVSQIDLLLNNKNTYLCLN
jgi:hypothetical protein